MKYILFIALILSVVSCTEHDGYTLTGHVPEAWEGKPVFLALDDTNQPHFIDSTKISGGKFRFLGKFDVPRYCTVSIYLDPNDRLTRSKIVNFSLFIDNAAIEATCDYSSKYPVFQISGSGTQTEYQNYLNEIQPMEDDRSKTFRAYGEAYYNSKDLAKAIDLAKLVTQKRLALRETQINYLKAHPESAISVKIAQELSDKNSDLSLKEIEGLFTCLSPEMQNSEMGQALRATILGKQVFIGGSFIDMELTAADGSKKKISDFVKPGTTTLIEFWASWCSPCRGEIPHMRNTYNTYHPKGLNIVSISIDSDPKNWHQALEEEKMPWEQLIDNTKAAFRAYNLSGVPSSILVNDKGKIINVNARGGWLDAAMQEIYD